jgi:hypothetical protein
MEVLEGDKMDRLEIKEKLQGFYDRIIHIKKMDYEKPPGYRERIKAEYAELKKDLRAERKRIDTVRWQNHASSDEMAVYFPAITEAASKLSVKSGSLPSQEMMSNLYDAEDDISFLLNGLKKQKS